jgi:hypothetical protein
MSRLNNHRRNRAFLSFRRRLLQTTSLLSLILLALSQRTFADSADAPLATRTFEIRETAEMGLDIKASSPGASWSRTGAEAAALLIEVDGTYNQDLFLWAGEKPFVYRVTLGRLERGPHTVVVRLNRPRSAPGATSAVVSSLIEQQLGGRHSEDDRLAIANSPILYQRPNTIDRFSDVPLLMYYETWHDGDNEVRVRYTIIFTNEDGGTPTAALMARWGRGTDIEWVYEVRFHDGKIVAEIIQGVEHKTKAFLGTRTMGSHPLIQDASDNNNFSDVVASPIRFALRPIKADLNNASRESVMDLNPWTYRIMAEELTREDRIKTDPRDVNSIVDPRTYLYVDVYAVQSGTVIAVELTNKESKRVSSDAGIPRLRIERSGYFRTAIRLPSNDSTGIDSISVRCYASEPAMPDAGCRQTELKGLFILDQNYRPQPLSFPVQARRDLRPGEDLVCERKSH